MSSNLFFLDFFFLFRHCKKKKKVNKGEKAFEVKPHNISPPIFLLSRSTFVYIFSSYFAIILHLLFIFLSLLDRMSTLRKLRQGMR